jgi:hypothetical protein
MSAAPEKPKGRKRMAELEAVLIPRATYRLQLRKGFGFDHAAALAPYLARPQLRLRLAPSEEAARQRERL